MRKRIMRHQLWEHIGYPDGGDRIRGDFIEIPKNVSFRKDTMILEYTKEGIDTIYTKEMTVFKGAENFDLIEIFMRDSFHNEFIHLKTGTAIIDNRRPYDDTLILDYQYFSTMKVTDPKTGKTGKYSMKGASWLDFIF